MNQASVSVEGTVATPEPKQSLIPEYFNSLGYGGFTFCSRLSHKCSIGFISGDMADQGIALLPPVADSLALYRPYVVNHCHSLELVDMLMDDHPNEA